MVADPAKQHGHTGHACQDKAATTANRAIAIGFGSAAKVIFRLHRGAFAIVASFERLCALSGPMIVEIVLIAQLAGGLRRSLRRRLRAAICPRSRGSANAQRGSTHGGTEACAGVRQIAGGAFAEYILESPVSFALCIGFRRFIDANRIEDLCKFRFEIRQSGIVFFFAVIDFRQIEGMCLLDLFFGHAQRFNFRRRCADRSPVSRPERRERSRRSPVIIIRTHSMRISRCFCFGFRAQIKIIFREEILFGESVLVRQPGNVARWLEAEIIFREADFIQFRQIVVGSLGSNWSRAFLGIERKIVVEGEIVFVVDR